MIPLNLSHKRRIYIKNILFSLLFLTMIGLIASLSLRYSYEADWTQSQRNSVSENTVSTLAVLKHKVNIKAFFSSTSTDAKQRLLYLLSAYQRHKSDITVEFFDIEAEPDLVRQWSIQSDGELMVEYGENSEHIQPPINEQVLTNTLYRLVREEERWIVFIEGHDERSPLGKASYDYANLAKILEQKGMKVRTLNLAATPHIPDNTALVVLADPRHDFLDKERQVLREYLQRQGNFLWLAEVDMADLSGLAEDFGVELLPGIIVDPEAQQLGDPRFTVIPDYPKHVITQDLQASTLFAAARGMEIIDDVDWRNAILLETLPRTWAETNETGEISLDISHDIAGPLILGLALTRRLSIESNEPKPVESKLGQSITDSSSLSTASIDQREQRSIIIGDADFLADAYLGVVGNLEFTVKLFNWLVRDDNLIEISASDPRNNRLELSESLQFIIGIGALVVMPGVLFSTGMLIWLIRRRR